MSAAIDKMFELPETCECDVCGVSYKPENWRGVIFCPDCTFEVGKIELQAEVDAHQRFADGGCDMYGSMAEPNLDRGWLDGYKAARYDTMIAKLRTERRATGRSGRSEATGSSRSENGTHEARDGEAGAPK